MKKDYIIEYEKKEYFSQNREDLILSAFFKNKKVGFYVDVGGFDPDYDSVTKYFYSRGWHGINIEPQKEKHKLFEKKRTRDININTAVGSENTKKTLRMYSSRGLSSLSERIKKEHEKNSNQDNEKFEDRLVEVTTLKDIFLKYEHEIPDKIDFMKIDVEGYEYDVIAGNDWSKYKPTVLCIEANHVVQDWRPMLKSNGYEKVFFDGINEYYALKNSEEIKLFNYDEHILTGMGGGIRSEDLDKIRQMAQEIDQFYKQYLLDAKKVKKLEEKVASLKSKCNNLELENAELKNLTTLGFAKKKLREKINE